MNPKVPCASFLLIPFSNIRKSTVTYLKYPDEISLFIPFPIIKKSILTNLQITGAISLLVPFSNIKKHTYESSKSWLKFLLIRF